MKTLEDSWKLKKLGVLCVCVSACVGGLTRKESQQWEQQHEGPKRDVPGGPVVKNPAANAGDTGSIPGLGRSHVLRGN